MPKQVTGEIVSHIRYGEEYMEMAVKATGVGEAKPGQFLNMRVDEARDPLLRRPFSIYFQDFERETLHVLYRLVGKGTRILSKMEVGAEVDLITPLGRGFSQAGLTPQTPTVLVAGGVGAAPLYFLALQLKEAGIPVYFFLGGRTAGDLAFRGKIEAAVGRRLMMTTEDGSLGRKGLVTSALREFLVHHSREGCQAFACGPTPMLREVAMLAKKHGDIPLQVSLESVMACGFGACLGCVCPAAAEPEGLHYKRVCTEGPVFLAGEVTW